PDDHRSRSHPDSSRFLPAIARHIFGLRGPGPYFLPLLGKSGRFAALSQHSLSHPSRSRPSLLPLEMALRAAPRLFDRLTRALHYPLRECLSNDLKTGSNLTSKRKLHQRSRSMTTESGLPPVTPNPGGLAETVVIVPTYNEAGNIAELVHQFFAVAGDL